MSGPRFAPVDEETSDLLTLVADVESPVGHDVPELFLRACERDAADHGGRVSVNRVRQLLADADIQPQRYSALWNQFTGPGRPMTKVRDTWDTCRGSQSHNNGKPLPVRIWHGRNGANA